MWKKPLDTTSYLRFVSMGVFFWVVKRKPGALQHLDKVDLLGMEMGVTLGRAERGPFLCTPFPDSLPPLPTPSILLAPGALCLSRAQVRCLLESSGSHTSMIALVLEGYGTC